jgi:hypothetical protein
VTQPATQTPPRQRPPEQPPEEQDESLAAKIAALLILITTLIRAFAASQNRLTRQAIRAATARVKAMSEDDFYDDAAIDKFTADMVKLVEAPQRQAAALTNAFQARVLKELTGRPVAPVKQVDVTRLRGIDHRDVYRRVTDEYRYQRSLGKSMTEARRLAQLRTEELADMDVTLAVRQQEHEFVKAKKQVLYYRRVIHPELSKDGTSCGLCIVASHRVYQKADLKPIHFRCNCVTLPVTDRSMDIGDLINDEDLQAIYKAAGGNTAKKLANTRFSVHEHGELGPVLTYRGDRWRGPADVREDTDRDKPTP